MILTNMILFSWSQNLDSPCNALVAILSTLWNNTIKRLSVDYIDLYYQHWCAISWPIEKSFLMPKYRVSPNTSIEQTVLSSRNNLLCHLLIFIIDIEKAKWSALVSVMHSHICPPNWIFIYHSWCQEAILSVLMIIAYSLLGYELLTGKNCCLEPTDFCLTMQFYEILSLRVIDRIRDVSSALGVSSDVQGLAQAQKPGPSIRLVEGSGSGLGPGFCSTKKQ